MSVVLIDSSSMGAQSYRALGENTYNSSRNPLPKSQDIGKIPPFEANGAGYQFLLAASQGNLERINNIIKELWEISILKTSESMTSPNSTSKSKALKAQTQAKKPVYKHVHIKPNSEALKENIASTGFSEIVGSDNTVTSKCSLFATKRLLDINKIKIKQSIKLEEVNALLLGVKQRLFGLHRINATNSDLYTPLHYAVRNEMWSVVAHLTNQGASWDVLSISKGNPGVRPYHQLNKTKDGLSEILKEYCRMEKEDIKFLTIFKLLSSPNLSLERKQEVIKDVQLRKQIIEIFTKAEAVAIVALCLTGSFKWDNAAVKNFYEFFIKDENTIDDYPLDSGISSSYFLYCVEMLVGSKKQDLLSAFFQIPYSPEWENLQLKADQEPTPANKKVLKNYISRFVAKSLGADLENPKTSDDIVKSQECTVIPIFIESHEGDIIDMGLAITCGSVNFIIHIDGAYSPHVRFEMLSGVVTEYLKTDAKNIYFGKPY